MAEDEQHPKFPETIDALKKSWSTVGSAVGLQPAGVLFFKNIFTIAPGAIGLFSFKEEFDNGSDAFYESAKLKAHALKVMETVNVAISALTDLKTLMPVLKSLGKKHVEYGVYPKHYDIVGAALIQTLAMGLGDAFTPALKAAWVELWGIIASTMMGAADYTYSATKWGLYCEPAAPEQESAVKASIAASKSWYTNPSRMPSARSQVPA